MDYTTFQKESTHVREKNTILLKQFEKRLQDKSLSIKTINKHINNIDFYINEFLLYNEIIEAKDGAIEIGEYLGYWFIKKTSRASPASIKSNAASLKKFYEFLLMQDMINTDNFRTLKETIKDELDDRIATLQRYDDPSITDMSEVRGL